MFLDLIRDKIAELPTNVSVLGPTSTCSRLYFSEVGSKFTLKVCDKCENVCFDYCCGREVTRFKRLCRLQPSMDALQRGSQPLPKHFRKVAGGVSLGQCMSFSGAVITVFNQSLTDVHMSGIHETKN